MCANPAGSLRPFHREHSRDRPQPQAGGGRRQVVAAESGYALLQQYRKKANDYLTRALEIDESGRGKYHVFMLL